MSSTSHRVLLVTGASSGIGRATTIELARTCAPCTLLLVARNVAGLEESIRLAREHVRDGDEVTFTSLPFDLGDVEQVGELIAHVTQQVGRLDVLVNNAGVGSNRPFIEADALADADRMLRVNLRAPIAVTQGLLPLLARQRGVVVNVSSVAGLIGTPHSAVYSATKWGLTGFSEALRAYAAPLGVRVTCVQPGPVPTPGWPHTKLAGRPIVGRLLACSPETIARCIARAANRRGGVAPVRPRTFAVLPLLRGLAPWLLRWVLSQVARRGIATTATGRDREASA